MGSNSRVYTRAVFDEFAEHHGLTEHVGNEILSDMDEVYKYAGGMALVIFDL